MQVQMLFGKRKSEDDAPELMEAWDEYCIDANYEGWERALEEAKQSWGDDLEFWNIITVELPDAQLLMALRRPELTLRVSA